MKKSADFFDAIIEKRGFLKIRIAADLERAKREKQFGTWYYVQSNKTELWRQRR